MRYTDLFRTPEFKPLFLSSAAHTAAQTLTGLALGTLVYRATDSPLLAAVSMFGPSLAQVLGATVLLSGADRLSPRAALTGVSAAFAAGTAVLAVPALPLWGVFLIVLAQGLVAALGGGVRWGLLHEILPGDGYLPGRSVFNAMHGVTQITGYATGGALLTALSPRAVLLLGALLYGTAAAVTRLGLTRRPPRAEGRPSPAETWHTNTRLWSSRPRRLTYLGLWLPNGLVVGCESLFVPYDPGAAGTLFACAALGMLVGDVTVGRFLPPRTRRRAATPLLLLLAAPYTLFVLRPPLPLAALCVTVASVGFGASLVQQEHLVRLTPPHLTGHALGLHSSGMLTVQGLAAALAGSVAQLTSPSTAMTLTALASVTVTLTLADTIRHMTTESPLTTDIAALQGGPADLAQYSGKAVLVVNVASKCGLTPQYTGLERLQERYAAQGFTVLGVPCNQFLGQEPGTAEEIAEFCSATYGVTFPMTEKVEVNGEGRHPLYERLVGFADAEGHSGDIRWNFEKFLIGRDGTVVARFSPQTEPEAAEVVAAIEAQLG
ncbi:MFS transporter [Streptomyces sp. NPDC018693]|uniref:MFS transporter n=1 Tax=unclassified Streptomyces TaxID=2593676 RepID=UPI0037AD2B55